MDIVAILAVGQPAEAKMPIFETFHERQSRLRSGSDDVFVYDKMPKPLRVQIVQLMYDMLGDADDASGYSQYSKNVQQSYEAIVNILQRALGTFHLPPKAEWDEQPAIEELANYMLAEENAERFMSALELACRIGENRASQVAYKGLTKAAERVEQIIADINTRIRQHGIGYEYDGEIVRVDSELIHAEAVKPALALLRNSVYKTADDEFRKAHEHFRSGDNQDALTNALKAFESTMKIIATKRGWSPDPKATASQLVDLCLRNGLIPSYWQTHFGGLRSMLESGIPTVRNRAGGHGGGPSPQPVPDSLVAYALHMTASTILFLANADRALG